MTGTRCSTCGAEVAWVLNDGGKPQILDKKTRLVAVVEPHPVSCHPQLVRWVHGHESHFATCPNAAVHRAPASTRQEQAALFPGDGPAPIDPDDGDRRRGHRMPKPREWR